MIGRPFPSPRIARDREIADAVAERLRHPDVIEPAAAIRQRPVGGAIAPPGIDLLRLGNARAGDVDPVAARLHREQLFAFDRRVRDDVEQLLVRPDVVLVRRDVEVADEDVAIAAVRMQRIAGRHLVEERELVLEFRIERRIGNVAAGRHVEIVHGHRRLQTGLVAERHRDVPRVDLAAEGPHVGLVEGMPRDDRDPVVALLSVQRDVLVAETLEALQRKRVVRTFRLLQAENVRPDRFNEFRDEIDAQTDGIDVPGRDGQAHAMDPA